ncbi:MAG: D-alanyl-D-alanine carboxypeptidase serine-type, family [Actinomycetia bacterium]|nr:D-alanyl-D-alanine carboxypeptidase serine-type, family [Actinomycetes bacterium]
MADPAPEARGRRPETRLQRRRSRDRGRRGLVVLLLIAAVGLAAFALRGPASAAAGTTPAQPGATPGWSARRIPQPVADEVADIHLQADLTRLLQGVGGCAAAADSMGSRAAVQPDGAFIPASTAKLLTGTAALSALGADFKFQTRALAPKAPQGGSVSRLYLQGGGDPVIVTPAFTAALEKDPETSGSTSTDLGVLADAIVAAGVRSIPGGIAVDDSRYESLRALPSWKAAYNIEVGPLGALTVNRGFAQFDGMRVQAADPAIYAGTALAQILTQKGVTVGPVTRAAPPAGAATVATLTSPPLHDIVATMLRTSDNTIAELLTREIGVKVSGKGTTAAGTAATIATLGKVGVPTTGVTLVDGSGLDRGDRLTCAALVATVAHEAATPADGLVAGLPVLGQSGTLTDVAKGSTIAGKLQAKTGTLDGVTALTGLVDGARPLSFAFVANGTFSTARNAQYKLQAAQIFAAFPRVPALADLVPAP